MVVEVQIHLATVTCAGPLLSRRTTARPLSIRPARLVLLDLDTTVDKLIGRETLIGVGALGRPTVIYTLLAAIADSILEQPFYAAIRQRTNVTKTRLPETRPTEDALVQNAIEVTGPLIWREAHILLNTLLVA